jgi:NAD(P)-dependent dehydrogenase (short-subunit alcohol dehydrogenase family)
MNRLKDKICIVTGGGKNIGKAICELFANEGAIVCIFDSDDKLGENTLYCIKSQGCNGCFLKVDVTNIEEINNSIEKVLKYYGRIDILINNVGGSEGLILEDIDELVFLKNIDLNLKSAVFCTKAVLPTMKKQHYGNVIFISSINALLGGFSESMYSASKGALHSLANVLVADYSKHGIRFNVVCPGSIPGDSETWQDREKKHPGILKNVSEIYPLGRIGVPNDVAYATMFLASDEAAWITGIVLPVDGGICATGNLPGGKWWEKI